MGEEKKSAKEGAASGEKSYDLAVLRENSVKLLGVTTSTFDGAMAKKNGKLTISVQKALLRIGKRGWQNK